MGWLKAIGEALTIIRVFTDPAKRREEYELALDKHAKKGLEYGEKICHHVDDYLAGNVSDRKFKLRYRYLRKKFFKYD